MTEQDTPQRGKVAFVTGAANGIGRAAALAFAREGANVVVADVSEQGNHETARMIEQAGGRVLAVRCDVSRDEAVKAALDRAVEAFGRLDYAFNNAGVEQPITPAADLTAEEWDRIVAIDLRGVFLCMKHQIPWMLRQGGRAIVNTSSGAGVKGFAGQAAYCAAKFGVMALGATVMPHNLYLHSGIVQTRAYGETLPEKREALRFATLDSTVALMFALTINASILILAAATFHKTGRTDVAELGEAHTLLAPLLGLAIAPTLFGIALLCCGINSTVTATLAGQIVMEGFLDIKLPAWLRRLITRAIAIIPAAIVTIWFGESGTARLLILTQVVLSLQLSFAVFPLVMFTSSRVKMGELVAPRWLIGLAGLIAIVIAALNVKLLVDFVTG
jgi:NADP-dependent 3-hydroxy acid dehydrogenase YdfG